MKIPLLVGITWPIFSMVPCNLIKLVMPCTSATFGYAIIPECSGPFNSSPNLSFASTLLLICICLFSFWLTLDASGIFALFLQNFSVALAYTLRRYVHYLSHLLAKETDYKSNLRIYRQFQILGRYYNLFQQDGLCTASIFIAMMGFIISTYSLINFGSELSVPELLLFAVIVVDTFLALLFYTTVLGQVKTASATLIDQVKLRKVVKVGSQVDRKWIEKFVTSFWELKSCMGDGNYVEQGTPLVVLDFCISQVVNLLLM